MPLPRPPTMVHLLVACRVAAPREADARDGQARKGQADGAETPLSRPLRWVLAPTSVVQDYWASRFPWPLDPRRLVVDYL